jgi:hypothetical protein
VGRRSAEQWARPQDRPDKVAVDVLVPTCNRPAELAVTLAGLAAQSEPAFAVVISDQSAGQPAWDHPAAAAMVRVLQAQGRPVTLLRHLPRRGLAEHRQFLLDQSTADQCLFLDDRRPEQTASFQAWDGPVAPERIRPGAPGFERWPLHSAANLSHVCAELSLQPGEWVPYHVAWLGGCVLYRREALDDAGGFRFWSTLPADHAGEDVVAQWQVMERYGGAGILPSGAVHLESPTTVTDRRVEAYDVVLNEDAV